MAKPCNWLLHAELTIMFLAMQKNSRNEAIALQARAKALREQQRTRLDARHKYVLGLVANRLDLEESVVEDFMLDGDQVGVTLAHCCFYVVVVVVLCAVCFTILQGSNVFSLQLDLFDSLFEANGRKALLFYYQQADTPVSSKTFSG